MSFDHETLVAFPNPSDFLPDRFSVAVGIYALWPSNKSRFDRQRKASSMMRIGHVGR